MQIFKHALFVALILAVVTGCRKDESSDFIWTKTSGAGIAYDSGITPDTLFAVAGESGGYPLFILAGKGGSTKVKYQSEFEGGYTSLVSTDTAIYLAGFSAGDLLLTSIDTSGAVRWDKVIATAGPTGFATISEYPGESLLVTASCHPDDLAAGSFATLLIGADGEVLQMNENFPGYLCSITGSVVTGESSVFVSITKNSGGDKSKASVARITDEGIIIWERELYNNVNFGAGSLAIISYSDSLFVSGRTELNVSDGVLVNSFIASLGTNGMVGWKQYLESSNMGTDMAIEAGNIVMLNSNCFVLSFIPLPGGSDSERMRVFDVCDSYDTETRGMSLSVTHDNNYFISGSKGGKFYYALREGNIRGEN